MNKKAQGMSLNVIIIAALALIVLVVLATIFMGRLGSFDKQVGTEAETRYKALSVTFSQCHPSFSAEQQFYSLWGEGSSEEAAEALDYIEDQIDTCKEGRDSEANCESFTGCSWD